MTTSKQLTALLGVALLIQPAFSPLLARSRKSDKLLSQAKEAESKGNYDQAATLAEQAVSNDPSDPAYMLELRRVRFEAGNAHVKNGQKIRAAGHLAEALAEFEKAYAADPANDNAEQEIRRTRQMIDRETNRGASANPQEAGMTPAELAKKENEKRFEAMLPVPVLKPLNPLPLNLKMNNQKPRVLYDTIGKLAGVNVLFDPDYEAQQQPKPTSIDLNNSTLEEALDYVSIATRSFWKPLSPNTIFVTVENPGKHRDYDEQLVKVFYLSNVTGPTELNEIVTMLRTVADITKLFQSTAQNALVVRAQADRMALAEKIIADLDRPRPEVVIDVLVMEVNSVHMRNLTAAFAPNGITSQLLFTPRNSILTNNANSTTTTTATSGGTGSGGVVTPITGGTTGTGTGTTTTTTTTGAVPLANIKHISLKDYSLTNVPNGLLEAVLNDTGTRVLQNPQIRAVDNYKATLKIGDKVPTATGSFGGGGVGGVGNSLLVNTQFTFLDTGVNLEITPRVHENKEVSLHVDVDISQVKDHIDLGGISQPIIGQRRATVDVRLRDGEINVIGGLIQKQDSKVTSGVPGLGNIPVLRRLFTSEKLEKDNTELLITMIPHIVRSAEVNPSNLKAVETGSEANVKLHYEPVKSVVVDGVPPSPGQNPPATAPIAAPPATAPAAPPVETPAGAPVALSFSPAAAETTLGSAVTVNLRVENAADLVGVQSRLKYDPAILNVVSVVSGELLQREGPPLVPSKNISNSAGETSVGLTRDPAGKGVTGSGNLVTVIFQAVGRGSTTVTLPDVTLRKSSGVVPVAEKPSITVHVQ